MTSPLSQATPCVATFVLPERNDARVSAIRAASGATSGAILSAGKAFDYQLNCSDIQGEQARLIKLFPDIDICVQPAAGRKKTLLICDMDSTLIGQECIDELADFAGVKSRVSDITERAMRGELNFETALKERVSLLKDLPLSALQRCFDERIHLNTGAKTLARTMKTHGAKTVIVSGGFTFFTSRIAQMAGFDAHQANILLENGAALSGEVGLPILGREAKLTALMDHSNTKPLTAIAIGDGANDLAMITAAGLGIAYYAKPLVASEAHCAINHTDLTTALYYQGYSDTDFTL